MNRRTFSTVLCVWVASLLTCSGAERWMWPEPYSQNAFKAYFKQLAENPNALSVPPFRIKATPFHPKAKELPPDNLTKSADAFIKSFLGPFADELKSLSSSELLGQLKGIAALRDACNKVDASGNLKLATNLFILATRQIKRGLIEDSLGAEQIAQIKALFPPSQISPVKCARIIQRETPEVTVSMEKLLALPPEEQSRYLMRAFEDERARNLVDEPDPGPLATFGAWFTTYKTVLSGQLDELVMLSNEEEMILGVLELLADFKARGGNLASKGDALRQDLKNKIPKLGTAIPWVALYIEGTNFTLGD